MVLKLAPYCFKQILWRVVAFLFRKTLSLSYLASPAGAIVVIENLEKSRYDATTAKLKGTRYLLSGLDS